MPTILFYNNNTNAMERYTRSLSQPMPFNSGSLTVREFKGSSNSEIFWTDRRTMEAWNSFRYIYGSSIYVGYCFKRPWEGRTWD